MRGLLSGGTEALFADRRSERSVHVFDAHGLAPHGARIDEGGAERGDRRSVCE